MDVFRFGTAGIGEQLTNQFLLRNSGTMPMDVASATPSCDCIQILRWPTNVAAGATGVVEVLFSPDKVGEVDYRVYIQTSDPDQPDIEYAIQGVVTAGSRSRADRNWTLYLGTPEAEQALREPGGVVWVDVRSPEAYARIRIPGSLQIPLYAVKTKGFLNGRQVVLVDEGYGSLVLEEECRKLRETGFSNVSIWYGGLNAWKRRDGRLEGEGGRDVSHIPPIALHDIAYSTDWLVVSVGAGMTNPTAGSVAIPFDAAKPEAFVSALNAAIEARPQVASVLIVTNTGKEYGTMAAAVNEIDAFVFFLEGGWTAWAENRQMMEALQHSHTAVVRNTSKSGSGAIVRPGGCGGCPK
jgi:rhodanese-related sulfurtransferase